MCNCILCPNYAQWITKYHLELNYSDEAHTAACAMLETGGYVQPTYEQTIPWDPVDWNLEQMNCEQPWNQMTEAAHG